MQCDATGKREKWIDAWAEEDAAAARNFGWASYVYIGAGPGERSAGGEMMARMFFGGSCTDARRAWPLVVRADCRWRARIRAIK